MIAIGEVGLYIYTLLKTHVKNGISGLPYMLHFMHAVDDCLSYGNKSWLDVMVKVM